MAVSGTIRLKRAFASFVWPWLRRLLRALATPFVWWWREFRRKPTVGIGVLIFAIAIGFFGSAKLLRIAAPKPELIVSPFEISEPVVKSLGIDGKSLTNIFADQLEHIIEDANSFSGNVRSSRMYGPLPDSPHIPVRTTFGIAFEGISLDQIVAVWHYFRYKQYLVSGDFVTEPGNHNVVYVRYQRNEEAESFGSGIDNPTAGTISDTFHELAVRLLSKLQPAIAVRHVLKQAFNCSGECSKNNFATALRLTTTWVKAEPKNPAALYYLGYSLKHMSRPKEAILVFDKAIDVDSGFDLAYHGKGTALMDIGEWKQSEISIKTALQLRKTPFPENNFGVDEYNQGHFDTAAEHYMRAADIDPTCDQYYKNLGFAFLRQGRNRDAENAFRQARRLNPIDLESLGGLAEALAREHKPDLAMDEVDFAALFWSPDTWQPYWAKGIISLEQHKPDVALQEFEQALERQPTATVWVEIAKVNRMQNQVEAAKASLDQALSLDTDDNYAQARAHHLLGVILAETGDAKEAKAQLELANKLTPGAAIQFATDCDPACK